jgi:hypothetical protein
MSFSSEFIGDLVERSVAAAGFEERLGTDGGPQQTLVRADDGVTGAGFVRVWGAPGSAHLDRMLHVRLLADPVDTHLFFLFGRSHTTMPHFHAQVVQFAPDACVFNADFLPRLDPVDHPDYYQQAFGALSKPYWRAVNDRNNVCSLAPANPAIAAFLTPWSIGCGAPTDRAELDRVAPQIHAFHEHYLELADALDYPAADPDALRDRDRRHLDAFFSDKLDPRAWRGVYGLIGDAAGKSLKQLMKTGLT